MKLQASYRSPFDAKDAFHPVSRREAAQLILQWRRYESGSVRSMARRDGSARGYVFNDWRNSVDAALVLNDAV